jgi:hypothetical protein
MRDRKEERKVEELDKENANLRTELKSAYEELGHERDEHREIMDLLRRRPDDVKVKVKRRGGFIRTALVGGVAYVLGTRAGRERFDQIAGWARKMRGRMQGTGEPRSLEAVHGGGMPRSSGSGVS